MHSRKSQALLSCLIFFAVAKGYEWIVEKPLNEWRVLAWSVAGVTIYIALSRLFGFDPHRTALRPSVSPLVHYVERWELRLGQATLAMLGTVAMAAHFIDNRYFVTAVVSGTLAAWTYFALRLYSGSYTARVRQSN